MRFTIFGRGGEMSRRLAKQLLDLAERYGEAQRNGTAIGLNFSQQGLGNLIGASREIVSLTLSLA